MKDRWVKRWYVSSTDRYSGETYTVAQDGEGRWGCSCWAWKKHQDQDCKHIIQIKREEEYKASPDYWQGYAYAVRVTPPLKLKVPRLGQDAKALWCTLAYNFCDSGENWMTPNQVEKWLGKAGWKAADKLLNTGLLRVRGTQMFAWDLSPEVCWSLLAGMNPRPGWFCDNDHWGPVAYLWRQVRKEREE